MNRQDLLVNLEWELETLRGERQNCQMRINDLDLQIQEYKDCIDGDLQFVPAAFFLDTLNSKKTNKVLVCDNLALYRDEGESK